ncbi:gamma-glutamylaminecyclotransferase-like, partial [Salmo salar]|uniref:Gamma-glutamylaminecyclotransferase n=1 Tax=Salmo salar TaxID=8030 RepID=A0ABM3EF10_SALSA
VFPDRCSLTGVSPDSRRVVGVGPFKLPQTGYTGVLPLNVGGHRVRGVYKVDDTMLSFLDTFEGCPTMYQRTSVQIELEDWKVEGRERSPGSIMEAFFYSTTSYQPAWLKHNFYESYDAYGDHGLVYIDRKDRAPLKDL